MAYKRPLTRNQSYIIAALWVVFAILFLFNAPLTLYSLLLLLISGFIVFYPIYKSKTGGNKKRSNKKKRR